MAKITIIGAGITGLATAYILHSKGHTITIIARDIPPLTPIDLSTASQSWASPWAGALYIPTSLPPLPAPQYLTMQRRTLPHLLHLATLTPSIATSIPLTDVADTPGATNWYSSFAPNYRALLPAELPDGCTSGGRWETVVVTPGTFLPWLRSWLEERGVRFVQGEVNDFSGTGADVVINAAGVGAKELAADPGVKGVRGQTAVVRWDGGREGGGKWGKGAYIRQGSEYTYVIPRGDGTAVVGGVKGEGERDGGVREGERADILRRVSGWVGRDVEVVRDNVGFRPGREGGPRVEREVLGGVKVVHAYGVGGEGYVYSFGLGEAVSELVDEFLAEGTKAKL